ALCSLEGKNEYIDMVVRHQQKIKDLFNGNTTSVSVDTELIYSDAIGEVVACVGHDRIQTEGAKHVLGCNCCNYVYVSAIEPKLKVLLKNFRLSDDIAFRFSEKSWADYPLTVDKFVDWINQIPQEEEVLNLFMDYETFGEHQWAESGIFDFMEHLPERIFSHSNFTFSTPSEVVANAHPVGKIHVPTPISWADEERDLTAWLGNDIQHEAVDKLYQLEDNVNASQDPSIHRDWKYLQTSDHFYYMCTKFLSDGDIHTYFSPYESTYEAFINYMNAL